MSDADSLCLFCDNRIGVISIAVFGVIVYLLLVSVCVWQIVTQTVTALVCFHLLSGIVGTIVHGLLGYGAHLKKKNFTIPWMVFTAFNIVIWAIFFVESVIMISAYDLGITKNRMGQRGHSTLTIAFTVLWEFYIYFFVVVYRFYKQLSTRVNNPA